MTQRRVWTPASLHVNVTASVTLTDILIQQRPLDGVRDDARQMFPREERR